MKAVEPLETKGLCLPTGGATMFMCRRQAPRGGYPLLGKIAMIKFTGWPDWSLRGFKKGFTRRKRL